MKKEINLPLHVFYILCLALFTFLVCLSFFLFSFDTLLSYFNYPLIGSFVISSIFPASFSSALACILPPLFLIGTVRHYEFKERFIRMFEVQSFFFIMLLIIFSGFMYYNVQLDDNVKAIMNVHYFSVFTRLLMSVYFYLSIRMCIMSQDMPFPSDFEHSYSNIGSNSNGLQNEICADFTFTDKDNQPLKQAEFAGNDPLKSKQIRKDAWKKHEEKLPQIVKSSITSVQLLGFLLVALILFPVSDLPFPKFGVSYSFLSVFSLYFYLLYQMRIRPYAVWRLPYICLNLYILIAYGFNEVFLWQFILLVFFICQCFVFYVLYRKSQNWFLQ